MGAVVMLWEAVVSYIDSDSDQSTGQKAFGWVAGLVGFGFARYVGISFLVPLLIGGVAIFVLKKFRPLTTNLLGMVAVAIGQVGWFTTAALIIPAGFAVVGLDIVLTTALLVWLIYRPSITAVVILIVFETIGLILNLFTIPDVHANSGQFKPLLVHILLRVFVIGFGIAFAVEKCRRKNLTGAINNGS
jgi:hypothetical protein